MSGRILAGSVAAVVAILTFVQLVWMFGMFPPADFLAGRNGALYAGTLVAWFFFTFVSLIAAAVILLMTGDNAPPVGKDERRLPGGSPAEMKRAA